MTAISSNSIYEQIYEYEQITESDPDSVSLKELADFLKRSQKSTVGGFKGKSAWRRIEELEEIRKLAQELKDFEW